MNHPIDEIVKETLDQLCEKHATLGFVLIAQDDKMVFARSAGLTVPGLEESADALEDLIDVLVEDTGEQRTPRSPMPTIPMEAIEAMSLTDLPPLPKLPEDRKFDFEKRWADSMSKVRDALGGSEPTDKLQLAQEALKSAEDIGSVTVGLIGDSLRLAMGVLNGIIGSPFPLSPEKVFSLVASCADKINPIKGLIDRLGLAEEAGYVIAALTAVGSMGKPQPSAEVSPEDFPV